MLDVGATADCKPEFLNQYAMMGAKYVEILLGRKEPKVGLLPTLQADFLLSKPPGKSMD